MAGECFQCNCETKDINQCNYCHLYYCDECFAEDREAQGITSSSYKDLCGQCVKTRTEQVIAYTRMYNQIRQSMNG
jgi:hypothetical protein